MIFVFGSNLAGRHGKGAALEARRYNGAINGLGVGRQGNSYAIPTKDEKLKILPLSHIELSVKDFINYARNHPEEVFFLTPIGTGLAGYSKREIWTILLESKPLPPNIVLASSWV